MTEAYKPHPLRIQLSRKKGWRKPPRAVVVARPTKWGNPFWHQAKFHGIELSLRLYRSMAEGVWNPSIVQGFADHYAAQTYDDHQKWLKRLGEHPIEAMTELKGKMLLCWCPLDRPCHADILCELANQEPA